MFQRSASRRAPICSAILAWVVLLASGSTARAQEITREGEIDGAPYKIVVPAGWNAATGTLITYAHGVWAPADRPNEMRDTRAPIGPPGAEHPAQCYPDPAGPDETDAGMGCNVADIGAALVAAGYAVAGSAYKEAGWVPHLAIEDTRKLRDHFVVEFGTPSLTLLLGQSMGSLASYQLAEDEGQSWTDGFVNLGGLGGQATHTLEHFLAVQLGMDAVGLWDPSWGPPGNVRNDLDYETEVVTSPRYAEAQPTDVRLDFLGRVLGFSSNWATENWELAGGLSHPLIDALEAAEFRASAWQANQFFATAGAAEWEARHGDGGLGTCDHAYRLSESDRAALVARGLSDAVIDGYLSHMNDLRFAATNGQALSNLAAFDLPGALLRPVLDVKSSSDGITLPYLDGIYRDAVAAAGRSHLLVQQYVGQTTHANSFTPEQVLDAVGAMKRWVDPATPVRPTSADFPSDHRWVSFDPPQSAYLEPNANLCPEPGTAVSLAAGAAALAALSRRSRKRVSGERSPKRAEKGRGLCCAALACMVFAVATPARGGHFNEYEGSIDGAPYRIVVPTNWDGKTLIVFAHILRLKFNGDVVAEDRSARTTTAGAIDPENCANTAPAPACQPTDVENGTHDSPGAMRLLEDHLLRHGYALAGSAWKENGWVPEMARDDTLALIPEFVRLVGRSPVRTLMMGASSGGGVAYKMAEEAGLPIDGYLVLGGLGAGATGTIDWVLAMQIALDAVGLWPPTWGSPGNVRNDMDFFADALPPILAMNPQNDPRLEFVRLVLGIPAGWGWGTAGELSDGAPQSVAGVPVARTRISQFNGDMLLASYYAAEWENRLGGGGQQNADHHYQLCEGDRAYLASRGLSAEVVDSFLERMGTHAVPPVDPATRAKFATFDYTGEIVRPVLAVHSTSDQIVVPFQDRVYRRAVAPDRAENLVQKFVTQTTHFSNYTPDQILDAVQAMDGWVQAGVAPGPAAFPSDHRWDSDFSPPESPFHPNYCPEPGTEISLAAGTAALAMLLRRRSARWPVG